MATKSSKVRAKKSYPPVVRSNEEYLFVPLTVGDTFPSEAQMADAIRKHVKARRVFSCFADVPVTPKTLVFRVDKDQNVWECAYSKKVLDLKGEKKTSYVGSHCRGGGFEFSL